MTFAAGAAKELDATVANMRFVKPADAGLVRRLARTHDALVIVRSIRERSSRRQSQTLRSFRP
ncbi:transketolase C-terminal domain-containing protein [Bordetella genomosp. 9]|uniref:transketolase C-terminal domain-containing protein n=1 Tax=Bordetella genomosp. 9 TaxID=1416803 RepID=UPI003593A065